jgi:hypothetical protein
MPRARTTTSPFESHQTTRTIGRPTAAAQDGANRPYKPERVAAGSIAALSRGGNWSLQPLAWPCGLPSADPCRQQSWQLGLGA